ncbi:MAG: dockerin type I domain-containing protein, partial [Candidatus Zixiibacteriota bacterium]
GCGIRCSPTSNPDISYNDVWDNYDGNFWGCPPGVGDTNWGRNWNDTPCDSFYNIIQNPLFVDAANGDFYLQEDSPCIDAGDPTSCPPFKSGCRVDMGAFEFDHGYVCGDCNGDGKVDIVDVVCLINYLFHGGPAPVPIEAGDVNCDHEVTIADVVYLINYLFKGGPTPCCPYSQTNGLAKVSTSEIDTPAWANKIALVGSSQEVSLNLNSNQDLGAVVLALKFAKPGSDVILKSFSFEGTKVEYIEFKEVLVNNEEKTVLIYAIPFEEDYIPAGEGSIVKLRFTGKDPITLQTTKISHQDGISLVSKDAEDLEFEFNTTPVAKSTKELPNEFSLSQNHPNPFNPHTLINYALPQDAKVSLVIYNVLGRKVKTLVNEYQTAGFQSAEWDGTNDNGSVTSSGIYFYKLVAGDYNQTKKMVMLK